MTLSIEAVEISDDGSSCLVAVEVDEIKAVVALDLPISSGDRDPLEEGLGEVPRAVEEHVPRLGGRSS